ncbi:hypothetical protein J2X75_002793 [Paenibacillus sp. 2003]|nr:hypothetical protein [Paenibacillus sp. 2003]
MRKHTKTYSSVSMLNTSPGGLSAPAMYFSMFGDNIESTTQPCKNLQAYRIRHKQEVFLIHDNKKTVMGICPPRLNHEIYYCFLLKDTFAVNVLSIVVQFT